MNNSQKGPARAKTMINTNYKQAIICSLAALAIVLSATTNARVLSVKKINNANGSKELSVTCSTRSKPERLVKKDGQWCDTKVTSLCSPQELRVAKKVCSSRYLRNLSEAQKNSEPIAQKVEPDTPLQKKDANPAKRQESLTSLHQEAVETQEQLLKVKKKLLELKRRELRLKSELAAIGS